MCRPLLTTLFILLLAQISQAADYYWVGGSGDWSDISHWATTSGGATRHNVVPTANDRVFFDAASFTGPNQLINVNNQSIFCLDMNWEAATNNPTFSAPAGYVLNVYGSLRLSANMIFSFRGSVNFLANTTGQSILMAGHRLRELVTFNGQGGGWTLQSPLQLDSTLLISAGTLNTGNQNLTCKRWFINPNSPVNLELGSSRIVVTGMAYTSRYIYQYDSATVEFKRGSLNINPGTSVLELNSNRPLLRATGVGSLTLGTVLFSNTLGKGRLISETGGAINLTELEMRTDSDVEGSVSFDRLILGAGKNFKFQAGFTYRLKKLTALGQCISPIQIFSSTPGTPFTFEATADSITGNFVSIKDVKATGGAKFVVRNAADLGNNSGWTIIAKLNNNLYWVGGTGNWSDPAHWSFSSGGAGGACVPTAGDNVFFDANSGSGFTVNIDIENAYCRNMNWVSATGTPVLSGSEEKGLHIFGSLSFIPGMRQQFRGDVYFEGDKTDNVIASATQVFLRNVIIEGTGSWSLADSLSIHLDLIFKQGNFNTKDQRVFCWSVLSSNNSQRSLTLGKTYWVLRRSDRDRYNSLVWEIHPQNLVLNADTSTIEFRDWFAQMRTIQANQKTLPLNYNVLIFGTEANIISNPNTRQNMDSVKCTLSIYFYGYNQTNVLEMVKPNQVIKITSGDTLAVKEILVPDLCTGMIELRATSPDQKAYVLSSHALLVRRMMIKDIHQIGVGPAVANNSIDLGGNQGWTINELIGRDLYWVGKGGTGNWFDTANWSLSSGGAGGECIPTSKDNVFFDASSFNGPNQKVENRNAHAYCRNMTWANASNNPDFFMLILNVFGSIDFPVPQTPSSSCVNLSLRAKEVGQTLRTRGFYIGDLSFEGPGSWALQDTLSTYGIQHIAGTFNSNDKPVNTAYFQAYNITGNTQVLNLGKSHWRINNNGAEFSYVAYFGTNLTIDPGNSLLEFTNTIPYVKVDGNLKFHNVLFSNTKGTSTWNTSSTFQLNMPKPYEVVFNHLEFRNNGILYGKNVIDSLIFSAGKSYQLDATLPQNIKEYFQVIGNNCNPIELLSTSLGTKAEVHMNGGRVLADFVQMRDQRGVGSTQFLAGANSTDIAGSNQNWIFDSPVDYVDEGILGKDVVLCKNNSLTLDANTYSAGETYRWSDNSTQATLPVNRAGTYHVAVTYDDGCILRDTVRVLPAADFTPNLSPDTTLCAEDDLVIDADLNLVGATYRWQDGSTAASIQVTQAGQYKVTIELSGCTASDSTQVRIISPTGISLGNDTSICAGQSLLLDASKAGGTSYTWSDGSTGSSLRVTAAGLYWVEVNDGQCTARDSINVAVLPALGLNLGRDTSFCENGSYLIRSNLGNLTYRWQDGSSNASLSVNAAGIYWLEATGNGCTERDSITIRAQALPRFELGGDTILCEGTSFNLHPGLSVAGNPTYRWSNGSTNSSINVQSSGIHTVTVTLNGCSFSDQKRFTFNPGPSFELGINRGFCIGESYRPDVAISGGRYLWNTGATTSRITITQTGLYYVDVMLNGCTKRDSAMYSFAPEPKFSLGRDTTLCAGENLNLNATTASATYRWNNGNTTATRTLTQTEIVWADVTVNGCRKRDSIRVQFIDLPKGILGRDSVLCAGQTRTYQINVPGATLRWQDNSSTNPYVISSPGLYILQASSGRCSVLDSVQIGYQAYPVFSLGPDTTLCNTQTLNLSPNVAGGVYLWNNGASTAQRQLDQPGTYWLEINLNGCARRDTLVLKKIILPQTLLDKDTMLCAGNPLRLNAQVNNASIRWQDGSTNTFFNVNQAGIYWAEASSAHCRVRDSIQVGYKPYPVFSLGRDTTLCNNEVLNVNPTVIGGVYRWNDGQSTAPKQLSQNGTYWLEVNLNGCVRSDTLVLRKIILPQTLLAKDTILCEGNTFRMTVQVNNASVQWQDGSNNTFFVVRQPGTYWVQVGSGRCVARDSIQVGYNPLPRFNLGKDTVMCNGETLTLTAITGIDQLRWNTGSTDPQIRVTASGIFWAQSVNRKCSFVDSIRVTYLSVPTVSIGPDTLVCDDKPYVLLANGHGNAPLVWSDGSAGKSLSITTPGTYWVRAYNDRCGTTDSMTLDFRECVVFKSFTPNAFSPDGNTSNEIFRPFLNELIQVRAYELQVFDRWGGQAFRSTDINTGWDGLIRGQKAPQGVYIYWFRIEYIDDKGPGNALVRGEVTLLR